MTTPKIFVEVHWPINYANTPQFSGQYATVRKEVDYASWMSAIGTRGQLTSVDINVALSIAAKKAAEFGAPIEMSRITPNRKKERDSGN